MRYPASDPYVNIKAVMDQKNIRIEKRKRWISFEFIEQLFKGFKKYGEIFVNILRK